MHNIIIFMYTYMSMLWFYVVSCVIRVGSFWVSVLRHLHVLYMYIYCTTNIQSCTCNMDNVHLRNCVAKKTILQTVRSIAIRLSYGHAD